MDRRMRYADLLRSFLSENPLSTSEDSNSTSNVEHGAQEAGEVERKDAPGASTRQEGPSVDLLQPSSALEERRRDRGSRRSGPDNAPTSSLLAKSVLKRRDSPSFGGKKSHQRTLPSSTSLKRDIHDADYQVEKHIVKDTSGNRKEQTHERCGRSGAPGETKSDAHAEPQPQPREPSDGVRASQKACATSSTDAPFHPKPKQATTHDGTIVLPKNGHSSHQPVAQRPRAAARSAMHEYAHVQIEKARALHLPGSSPPEGAGIERVLHLLPKHASVSPRMQQASASPALELASLMIRPASQSQAARDLPEPESLWSSLRTNLEQRNDPSDSTNHTGSPQPQVVCVNPKPVLSESPATASQPRSVRRTPSDTSNGPSSCTASWNDESDSLGGKKRKLSTETDETPSYEPDVLATELFGQTKQCNPHQAKHPRILTSPADGPIMEQEQAVLPPSRSTHSSRKIDESSFVTRPSGSSSPSARRGVSRAVMQLDQTCDATSVSGEELFLLFEEGKRLKRSAQQEKAASPISSQYAVKLFQSALLFVRFSIYYSRENKSRPKHANTDCAVKFYSRLEKLAAAAGSGFAEAKNDVGVAASTILRSYCILCMYRLRLSFIATAAPALAEDLSVMDGSPQSVGDKVAADGDRSLEIESEPACEVGSVRVPANLANRAKDILDISAISAKGFLMWKRGTSALKKFGVPFDNSMNPMETDPLRFASKMAKLRIGRP